MEMGREREKGVPSNRKGDGGWRPWAFSLIAPVSSYCVCSGGVLGRFMQMHRGGCFCSHANRADNGQACWSPPPPVHHRSWSVRDFFINSHSWYKAVRCNVSVPCSPGESRGGFDIPTNNIYNNEMPPAGYNAFRHDWRLGRRWWSRANHIDEPQLPFFVGGSQIFGGETLSPALVINDLHRLFSRTMQPLSYSSLPSYPSISSFFRRRCFYLVPSGWWKSVRCLDRFLHKPGWSVILKNIFTTTPKYYMIIFMSFVFLITARQLGREGGLGLTPEEEEEEE